MSLLHVTPQYGTENNETSQFLHFLQVAVIIIPGNWAPKSIFSSALGRVPSSRPVRDHHPAAGILRKPGFSSRPLPYCPKTPQDGRSVYPFICTTLLYACSFPRTSQVGFQDLASSGARRYWGLGLGRISTVLPTSRPRGTPAHGQIPGSRASITAPGWTREPCAAARASSKSPTIGRARCNACRLFSLIIYSPTLALENAPLFLLLTPNSFLQGP